MKADFNLELTGLDDSELSRLLAARRSPTGGLTDLEDDIPPAGETPITRPGEIWLMGSTGRGDGAHRVMAGDATDRVQVDRLMNGERAGMIFVRPAIFLQTIIYAKYSQSASR